MELVKNTDEKIGPVVIQHTPENGITHKVPSDWSGKKIARWRKINKIKIDEAEQRILDGVYRRGSR